MKKYILFISSLFFVIFAFYGFFYDRIDKDGILTVINSKHYGHFEIKEKIIEHAIYNRKKIFCLYGPPGVGKTSLVSHLANAVDYDLVKFSVGGFENSNQVEEIIKQNINIKRNNIIVLIDEIDMLEGGEDKLIEFVKNNNFIFFATANDKFDINSNLKDYMEFARLSGFNEDEKLEIVKKHLWSEICKEKIFRKAILA